MVSPAGEAEDRHHGPVKCTWSISFNESRSQRSLFLGSGSGLLTKGSWFFNSWLCFFQGGVCLLDQCGLAVHLKQGCP